MAISFPALLKLANFPKGQVDQLMENIDYVSDTDKLKLSDTAWSFISAKYYVQLALERIHLLDDIKQGKKKYNPNDFEEIKTRLIVDLVHKLQTVESQDSIEEVRKQLEKYKTQPFSQDKTTSPPLAHNPAPAGSVAGGPPPKS